MVSGQWSVISGPWSVVCGQLPSPPVSDVGPFLKSSLHTVKIYFLGIENVLRAMDTIDLSLCEVRSTCRFVFTLHRDRSTEPEPRRRFSSQILQCSRIHYQGLLETSLFRDCLICLNGRE